MNTDTPRTAAVIANYNYILQFTDLLRYCKDMTANSEQLERELNAANKRLAEFSAYYNNPMNFLP